MAPISNTQIIRRFTSEFINTASPTLAAELISPTAVFHASGMPPLRGPEGYLGLLGMLRVGFPDVQWTLEDTVVEGTKWLRASPCAARTRGRSWASHPVDSPSLSQAWGSTASQTVRLWKNRESPTCSEILQQIGAIPPPA
jgi:hypothetical protein